MKPNNVVPLVLLCGMLASAGVILHGYSSARVVDDASQIQSSAWQPRYSQQLSRQFKSNAYLAGVSEQRAYTVLQQHANDTHNIREASELKQIHQQHMVQMAKRFDAYLHANPAFRARSVRAVTSDDLAICRSAPLNFVSAQGKM